jgi:ABC-type lipoprotein release transport system permease subunit
MAASLCCLMGYISLLLSTVILAACLRPLRRAARANPIDVLRAP